MRCLPGKMLGLTIGRAVVMPHIRTLMGERFAL
jgi:hypothetical protein